MEMHIIERKIKKAELAYERDKNGPNALALFACYVLAGRTIDPDGVYLSKAYHVAVTAHKEDLLDVKIISAELYANVLLGNFESAGELIGRLEAHGSFLNKNLPLFYGQILYFSSIVQSKTEKSRTARKIQKNLELLYEKTELTALIALTGSMHRVISGDVRLCAKMYSEALRNGLRSIYFFLDIYDILVSEEEYTAEMNELSRNIIPWALSNGLPVDEILKRLEKRTIIGVLFSLSTRHLSKIYELYNRPDAFQCLCQKLIYEGSTDEKSLSYYMSALDKGLNLRGLEQISVRAAYENKYYKLPLETVETALETSGDYDSLQLAFLHAILASSSKTDGKIYDSTVKFGLSAYSDNMRGSNYNLIYKYLFDLYPDDKRFADIMQEELFKYELEFKGLSPKSVCVYEYSRRGVSVYPVNGNKAYITAISNFNCYFLGEDAREYLNIQDYSVRKTLDLETAERAGLCEALYAGGCQSAEVIIALAQEYLGLETLTKNNIDVLQRAANIDIISDSLKLDICGRLAEHYAHLEQYSIAVHYFSLIGIDAIRPYAAEGALNTFIAMGRYREAVFIIAKKRRELADEVVFNSLKILEEHADTPEIASMCYELVLNDYCSSEILSLILKNFRGTPSEWLIIANKIHSLGFDVSQLYEKIIVNGIFVGSIGNDCNEAFIKLYNADKAHAAIPKYVYFCCYEVIKNGKRIPDSLADVLYDIYMSDERQDALLCCALALNYIRDGRQDRASVISEAAAELEENGIVFPEFKEYQDKSFISSYIEKNTPFVYVRTAHRNVFFRYKTNEMQTFAKKKMKYFRFGMYFVSVPLFYGEKITYYFEEENGLKTEAQTYTKTHMRLIEQFSDQFYAINNAVIYGNMMKYDMVEALIEDRLASNEQFPIITL